MRKMRSNRKYFLLVIARSHKLCNGFRHRHEFKYLVENVDITLISMYDENMFFFFLNKKFCKLVSRKKNLPYFEYIFYAYACICKYKYRK